MYFLACPAQASRNKVIDKEETEAALSLLRYSCEYFNNRIEKSGFSDRLKTVGVVYGCQ